VLFVGDDILQEYDIEIYGNEKSKLKDRLAEIWANIKNIKTGESMNVCIWWKDNNGIIHDETPNLPVKLRDVVDNAWLESCKK
jgi:hypothetical protein